MKDRKFLFEEDSVWHALAVMALPAIASQLITLVYNIADTWFVGRTNNPYMVAACSLVLPVYMITIVISNIFGTGGGTLKEIPVRHLRRGYSCRYRDFPL